ncbi:MAG: hypothetical protein PHF66_14295, partial [Desulfobacteraceae bacterium]|nr:hypothetical protein [Desulfobacteraceae bacterium]
AAPNPWVERRRQRTCKLLETDIPGHPVFEKGAFCCPLRFPPRHWVKGHDSHSAGQRLGDIPHHGQMLRSAEDKKPFGSQAVYLPFDGAEQFRRILDFVQKNGRRVVL